MNSAQSPAPPCEAPTPRRRRGAMPAISDDAVSSPGSQWPSSQGPLPRFLRRRRKQSCTISKSARWEKPSVKVYSAKAPALSSKRKPTSLAKSYDCVLPSPLCGAWKPWLYQPAHALLKPSSCPKAENKRVFPRCVPGTNFSMHGLSLVCSTPGGTAQGRGSHTKLSGCMRPAEHLRTGVEGTKRWPHIVEQTAPLATWVVFALSSHLTLALPSILGTSQGSGSQENVAGSRAPDVQAKTWWDGTYPRSHCGVQTPPSTTTCPSAQGRAGAPTV
mmetsp:Transcript_87513/g.245768  ORF Transcript_87513/g.245768 Transcript_87513/m.245768 type:complete len:274 (-) Transcript_87513:175-996(-)